MKNLFEIVEGVKGCQFASISFISDGGIPKKVINGNVTKLVKCQVQIGYNYENAVNNRLTKQGSEATFEAERLPWGEWEIPNKVISHKGVRYLRYYYTANGAIDTIWFVNGRIATADEFSTIVEYLRSKEKDSKRQTIAGLVENQVKPRTVKFANILTLAVGGEVWQRDQSQEQLRLAE